MRVCDRCRREITGEKISELNGTKVELCSFCCDYILNHIQNYSPTKQSFSDKLAKKIIGK